MENIEHPAIAEVNAARKESWSLRLADKVTAFCGNMNFVYFHAALFGTWILIMGFLAKVDPFPFSLLTLVVSLEAIFLFSLVLIGQTRGQAKSDAKAAHDYVEQELELKNNTALTSAIHDLTIDVHSILTNGKTDGDKNV